jgi:hypothetical protein
MEGLSGSSLVAAVLSLSGVVITGLLTTLTAIRSGKDRRARNSDRRMIEEETTDVILRRVRAELDRAYETIDIKDAQIRRYVRFVAANRVQFAALGIKVPEVDPDEGPTLYEQGQRIRLEVDRAAADDAVSMQRKVDDDEREERRYDEKRRLRARPREERD